MLFPKRRIIYEKVPLSLKRIFCKLPFSWIAGKNYKSFERGNWFDLATREEIVAYQQKALEEILKHAINRYQLISLRSTVDKFNPFEALTAFPPIEKGNSEELG